MTKPEKRRQITYMQLCEEHRRIANHLHEVYKGRSHVQKAARFGKMLGEYSAERVSGMIKEISQTAEKVLPPPEMAMPLLEESFYAAEALILAEHWKKYPDVVCSLNDHKIAHMFEQLNDAVKLADEDETFRASLRTFMQGKGESPVDFDEEGNLRYRISVKRKSCSRGMGKQGI